MPQQPDITGIMAQVNAEQERLESMSTRAAQSMRAMESAVEDLKRARKPKAPQVGFKEVIAVLQASMQASAEYRAQSAAASKTMQATLATMAQALGEMKELYEDLATRPEPRRLTREDVEAALGGLALPAPVVNVPAPVVNVPEQPVSVPAPVVTVTEQPVDNSELLAAVNALVEQSGQRVEVSGITRDSEGNIAGLVVERQQSVH